MSTYRSISFCRELLPRAAIAHNYSVQFGQDSKAGKVLVVERQSPAVWRELHESAVAKEWDWVIEEVLPGTAQLDLKEGLRGLGPGGFLALAEQSGNDEEFLPLFARLSDRALPILQRQTVFLLPETLSASPLELEDLVETWADQLYEQLSRGQTSAFTFVRVGDAGTDPGMLDRMIEHMHSKIAALIFESGRDDREGPILLVGPTGTGKSYGMRLFAKKTWGRDKFVNVNLAAVTETTLESRVRGYVRGAFTGADPAGKASWFEEAKGGTLFLDEFQSVKKEYQTQFLDLLNAVSDKVEIARVGDDKARQVFQVKVVLAINEDLGELLRTDRLRHDLFYRIRRIIRFKTLKERLSDPDTNRANLMVLLMTYRWRLAPIIQQSSRGRAVDGVTVDDLPASRIHAMFAQFEEAAIDAMLCHDWPGNLRELERVASDLFSDADQRLDSAIRYEHVRQVIAEFVIPQPTQALQPTPPASAISESTRVILASVERALRQQRFNIGSILDGLKVYKLGSRPTLRRFLVKHKDLLSADIAAESKIKRFMHMCE